MIPDGHPFFFLEPLFARGGALFSFSRYVYTPDSLFDQREEFEVEGADISVDWLEYQFRALEPDQELAIHSKVVIEGRTAHIPMLDFTSNQIGPAQLQRLKAFLPERVFSTASFYNSGRSFHAYSTHLLSPKEWTVFLGRALLINPRAGTDIIDTRWIGHRLIAGYCSLRFSNNSHQYQGMPTKVGVRAFIEGKPVAPDQPCHHV